MHQNRFLFQNSRCGAIRPARLDEGKKTSIGSVLRAWEALTGQIPHRGMSCSMGRPSLWLQEHQSHHLRPWMERAGVGQCLRMVPWARWSSAPSPMLQHFELESDFVAPTAFHPMLQPIKIAPIQVRLCLSCQIQQQHRHHCNASSPREREMLQ